MQKATILLGLKAEGEAIFFYTKLKTLTTDGNELRSIEHILQEEKDHRDILLKMLEKRQQEPRKEKLLVAFQT